MIFNLKQVAICLLTEETTALFIFWCHYFSKIIFDLLPWGTDQYLKLNKEDVL